MAAPSRRHRHPPVRTGWFWAAIILAALATLVVAGIALNALVRDASPPRASTAPASTRSSPATASATASASPTDDLVQDALTVKPLDDLARGDRVIYQGRVCTWQSWDAAVPLRDRTTSTIKCPGRKEFQIQTGHLTPVERKQPAR